MIIAAGFPSIVEKYSKFYEECFSKAGFIHFKKALSGFILSDNKTLEAINEMFVIEPRNQSSFNRFFNRQNFDIEQINKKRIEMLQQNEATRFKTEKKKKGVLAIDDSLLKHYGKHFDNIYNLYDHVYENYRWSHDLVTLHYSDATTDYPLKYELWKPADWEAVAKYYTSLGFHINEKKWQERKSEKSKWRKYMRDRHRPLSKKAPEVRKIYRTKIQIAEDLVREFVKEYPELDFPLTFDSGYTSADFCQILDEDLGLAYVGCLKTDQCIIRKGNKKQLLKDFLKELRAQHFDPNNKKVVFQKTTYTFRGEKKTAYAYFANHRIKGYEKKQRLVISYGKEDLSDEAKFTITNRLSWYPSGILRIRRHRWPVETFYQESKDEGLEKYQVRNIKAIESYIAFIVVTFSILTCTVHDDELLSSIQQRLNIQAVGTLPFSRKVMKAEAILLLLQFVFEMQKQGTSLQQIFHTLTSYM